MRTRIVAFAAGGIIAAVIVVAGSGGDLDRMVYGDGQIHRYVAEHIGAEPGSIDERVATVGTSLRYGRIGLPAMIWTLSGGDPIAMRIVHPLVIIVSAGLASTAVTALFPSAGPIAAIVLFIAPGFALSVDGGYAEVLALALALWAMYRALEARFASAAIVFGLAILTKENAGALLIGTLAWIVVVRRDRRGWWLFAGVALPAVWHAYVWARYGSLPLLDPYLSSPTGLDAPVEGLVRSLAASLSTEALLAAAVHVALGAVAVVLARSSLYGTAGAISALQLLSMSPWTWRFIGDGLRVSTFLEVMVLLSVVALARPRWCHPAALSPRASVRDLAA